MNYPVGLVLDSQTELRRREMAATPCRLNMRAMPAVSALVLPTRCAAMEVDCAACDLCRGKPGHKAEARSPLSEKPAPDRGNRENASDGGRAPETNRQHHMKTHPLSFTLALMIALGAGGCASVRRIAVNKLGDALASGGTTFAEDDDPEFIKAAAPFSLKLMESLLHESRKHRGLLLATSSGFTQYAYAFVQQDAEELEDRDVAASLEMRQRARRLYLRARDYALRGLESAHPGFTTALHAHALAAVRKLNKRDVPQVYWAAASWAGAVAIIKDNPDLIADLPTIQALMDRALELDERYDHGAIHSFLISYEMSRPAGETERIARARAHFERAVQLTGGEQAGPFVSLAESVAIEQQNRVEFESSLKRALAVDADAKPEWRLANLVMQRRARWLLAHEDDLIAKEQN